MSKTKQKKPMTLAYMQRVLDSLMQDGAIKKVIVGGEIRYVATESLDAAVKAGAKLVA